MASSPKHDYYQTLGVGRDAGQEEIRKSYRKLARKHHPDVNPGDKKAEGLFKEAQKAYDIISDTEKRKLYDQFGMAAFEGVGAGPRSNASEWSARHGGPGPGASGFENIDLSAFFNNQGSGAGQPSDFAEGAHNASIFEELIGRVRGDRGSKKRAPRAPKATEVHLTIPFLTGVRGGETSIEVQREDGTQNIR